MTDPGKGPGLRPERPAPKPVSVHQSLWHHCIESCVIVAFATWLAAVLLPRAIPLWEMTGPLAVLTAVTWRVAVTVTRSAVVSGWLLAWGVVLTAWFTTARITGAWSGDMAGALVLAVVLLTPFGPPAIGHYRTAGTRDYAAEARAAELAELGRWEMMFTRMGVRGIRVSEVFRHENGLQVHGSLGKASDEHGIFTFDKLKMLAAEVATHTRTARDSVHFEQPDRDNSATFVMHLRTRKGKRTVQYLPENDRPATIGKPLELGRHDNGRPFRLLLREIVVMIVGVVGSGKSNLLNVFTAQLARCEDVIIVCIDLKLRMARPWIQAWLDDPAHVRRPVIDWLATTRTEAYLMLETLIAAGDARARTAIGEKIIPRRKQPAVILIMDETAVATGHDRKDEGVSSRKLAILLARFAETYRSEAMSPVVAAVRSDVETMGLSALKAQTLARIGLRVSQAGDGDSIFPDHHDAAVALSRIQDEGAGLALVRGKINPPVHFYRMTPKLAYRIARRTGPWRPAPDPHLEQAMGEAYTNRWERMEALLDEWRATADAFHAEIGTGGAPDPDESTGGAGGTATATRTRPAPAGDDIDVDQAWRGIIANIEDPDGKVHPARQRMRELLFRAGPRGYTVGALGKILREEDPERKGIHRNTLHEWLRSDEELGRVRSKARVKNDPYARWVWIRQAGDGEILAAGQPDEDDEEGGDW